MDRGLDTNSNAVDGIQDEDGHINISDVIEVIETTDPSFSTHQQGDGAAMIPGGRVAGGNSSGGGSRRHNAYVKIIEQPASKALRFRYECEGRSAGSIPGSTSTPENKTFPAIQVVGYKGRAVVVVSCVTKDQPYRPHPHNLVGKEGCRKGVCTVELNENTMAVQFSNLGIQCVKKKDIEEALRVREEIRVDPYRTGFAHRNQPTSIDLNAVRLCFQVFLEGDVSGKFTVALDPVVSEPIYDKKAMCDLVICKISHASCTVAGGLDMILLCEKVAKEDIQVRFYEEREGQVVWEAYGDFQPSQVHKQTAIAFKTPRYKTLEVQQSVKVFMQLKRPSDGVSSEPHPFTLLPLDSDPVEYKQKRKRFGYDPHVLQELQRQDNNSSLLQTSPMLLNIPGESSVKTEPREHSPQPYTKMYGGGLYSPGGSSQHSTTPQYRVPMSVSPAGTSPSPGLEYQMDTYTVPQQYSNNLNIPPDPLSISPIPSTNTLVGQFTTQHQTNTMFNSNNFTMNTFNQVNNLNSAANQFTVEPSTSTGMAINQENASAGLSSLLDLDSQELLPKCNSAELNPLYGNLTDNLSNNLSLTDNRDVNQHQDDNMNMTDSFTRLTNEISNLNDLYKPNNL